MADAVAAPARRVLSAAARSDAGRVRTNNEDLPILDAERGLFGVIDGVGGQAAGELAAAIARDVVLQRLARPLGTPAERVREAIAIANNEIYRRASSSPELAGMTCVVTLALVSDGRLTIGHVGDTRLYKIRPGGVRKLTHDHSPVGEREDAGELSEADAMRHPRRHEVFRDVGGALRDKDEDDHVEVLDDTFEDDAALLVCSDGLTDMIPVAMIQSVIRSHAGDPQAVADALVAAANEAGGRDNVTVVYAEGPRFAAALHANPGGATTRGAVPVPARPPGRFRRAGQAIVTSRMTWFACGVALGVIAALFLLWRATEVPPVARRTIVAAPHGATTFGSLAAAVADARTGDVIQLEPGTYAERVALPDGVSLVARVPGTSTFVRGGPAASPTDEWVAITATGDGGGVISGVRIASTPELPVQVGIRVSGHGRIITLVETDGAMRAGVEIGPGSTSSLQGSRLLASSPAVIVAEGSELDARGNVFVRPASPTPPVAAEPTPRPRARSGSAPTRRLPPPVVSVPAITLGSGAQAVLQQNVFAGFGPEPVQGMAAEAREHLRNANVVVSADPSSLR